MGYQGEQPGCQTMTGGSPAGHGMVAFGDICGIRILPRQVPVAPLFIVVVPGVREDD